MDDESRPSAEHAQPVAPPIAPTPPLTLEYRSAGSVSNYAPVAWPLSPAHVVITAVLTVPVVLVAVGFGIAGIILSGNASGVFLFGGLLIGGTVLGVPLIAAAIWHRSTRWRGIAVGLWIGLGVSALIEGVCFCGQIL